MLSFLFCLMNDLRKLKGMVDVGLINQAVEENNSLMIFISLILNIYCVCLVGVHGKYI